MQKHEREDCNLAEYGGPPVMLSAFVDFIDGTGPARKAVELGGPTPELIRAVSIAAHGALRFNEWRCGYCSALCTTLNCRNCGAHRGL